MYAVFKVFSLFVGEKIKEENAHSALLKNHYLMSILVSYKFHSNMYCFCTISLLKWMFVLLD